VAAVERGSKPPDRAGAGLAGRFMSAPGSGAESGPTLAPSGEQFEIAHGEQRATIVEVGAGVREYLVGGRPVLDAYPLHELSDGAHGAPLIPWPNRLADGRYGFDGAQHQLSLSEPERRNAIHGLMRWRPWTAVEHRSTRVVMAARLHPLVGYPFTLDLQIAYELRDAGLVVTTTATNVGAHACPYGAGQHPYLSPGAGLIDGCDLLLPAATRVLVDAERRLPCGREAVCGGDYDFRHARPIAGVRLDDAFTDLERDPGGNATVVLIAADGARVELWMDERYSFVELYTGDTLAPHRRRGGLAVEPMTCAPNAFRSAEGLARLEPGASLTSRWGVRLA
jgi:aldose 1-epimerase